VCPVSRFYVFLWPFIPMMLLFSPPLWYWCVIGPSNGDPYVGPCLEYVDRVVDWCEKHGLQVSA
jgi:hypothetical protein